MFLVYCAHLLLILERTQITKFLLILRTFSFYSPFLKCQCFWPYVRVKSQPFFTHITETKPLCLMDSPLSYLEQHIFDPILLPVLVAGFKPTIL